MVIFLYCLFGLAGLLAGGMLLVHGAVGIAARLGVSPLLIGVVLVGFGTSTPELLTSVSAALVGAPGIATGNVVGSNIANILLILGMTALLQPVRLDRSTLTLDGSAMAAATLLAVPMLLSANIGRLDGAVLCAALIAYLLLRLRNDHAEEAAVDAPSALMPAIVSFAGGLALTLLGAHLLVTGAVDTARLLNISEAVIGVTIVAVGTSLPELVTSVIAARRGHAELAIGNIIGSNIFNITGILGLTALMSPLDVPASIASFDQWLMVGATAALLGAGIIFGRLSRLTGTLFLLTYALYLAGLLKSL